jgi:hypothetical protein
MAQCPLPGDCVAKLGKVHATSNNRIAAGTLLNQNCVFESGVESILRTSLLKIVLQHNRGEADAGRQVSLTDRVENGPKRT